MGISDREIEIIQALQEKIMVYDKAMCDSCDVCAELDCLLSFAEAARAYDYRRPNMVDDNVVEIIQGRHPLQEQVVDTFVPNDVYLVGGCAEGIERQHSASRRSVLLCTGANACGKSVFLKQTALIQYMAQVCQRVAAYNFF